MRMVGSYTFTGNESMTYNSTYGFVNFQGLSSVIKPTSGSSAVANVLMADYVAGSVLNCEDASYNLIVAVNTSGVVRIKNTSWTSESDAVTALTGKVLNYELATPTTESIDPVPYNFLEVEGGGTVETTQEQTPVIDNCLDVGYLTL